MFCATTWKFTRTLQDWRTRVFLSLCLLVKILDKFAPTQNIRALSKRYYVSVLKRTEYLQKKHTTYSENRILSYKKHTTYSDCLHKFGLMVAERIEELSKKRIPKTCSKIADVLGLYIQVMSLAFSFILISIKHQD